MEINVNDIVECWNSRDYISFCAGEKTKVLKIKRAYNNRLRLWLKPKHSSATWFKAENFRVVERVKDMSQIFLVYKLKETEENNFDIDHNGQAFRFNSENEARDEIKLKLESNPEYIYGIFPLSQIGRVEKPPIKFTTVYKK